jgi:D-arabinose 1-dehydrogenase-like Zn-dependent alcohol dehydrogenase
VVQESILLEELMGGWGIVMAKARAVVQVGDKHFEVQQFDLPRIGPDEALLRIEASGICGSDVDQYDGKLNGLLSLAMLPGHEPVGLSAEIGVEADRRVIV